MQISSRFTLAVHIFACIVTFKDELAAIKLKDVMHFSFCRQAICIVGDVFKKIKNLLF